MLACFDQGVIKLTKSYQPLDVLVDAKSII